MRNGRAPAGFRPNGWPFGLQSRCRLGTFEPAKNLESGEVLALGNPCETAEHLQSRSRLGTFEAAESMEVSARGNPCETAEPQQDSGPMGGRLVCRADKGNFFHWHFFASDMHFFERPSSRHLERKGCIIAFGPTAPTLFNQSACGFVVAFDCAFGFLATLQPYISVPPKFFTNVF